MWQLDQKLSAPHSHSHSHGQDIPHVHTVADRQLPQVVHGTLQLPFETRQKSRFRATLTDGTQVGVVLERGHILRGGDLLTGTHAYVVQVEAAPEAVSTVVHNNSRLLARAAYHLGNRHVPLQVGDQWLRYLQDHVLDDMCRQLGLDVRHERAPFEPESGAYGSHPHQHD